MSLAEKFDEFCREHEITPRFTYYTLVKEGFYAGAEATMGEIETHGIWADINAEIDRFKGQK